MSSVHATVAGPDSGSGEAGGLDRQPIGAYLKRQRELRGISADELARATRIPLRSLERLESGTFDGQVDGFVRGFVRTVASALGLDPDETVARMLAEPIGDAATGLPDTRAWPRALVALALVVAIGLAVGLVRIAATGARDDERGSGSEIVVRADPVRALAEAQAGVAASMPGAVAAPPPEAAGPPPPAP